MKYLNAPTNDVDAVMKQADVLRALIDSLDTTKPDLTDVETVREAAKAYFQRCFDRGIKAGNLGLYAALGINNTIAKDIVNGRYPTNRVSRDTVMLLKDLQAQMAQYREVLGAEGLLNPVLTIFWQKNYDGLSDNQTIYVNNDISDGHAKTLEELKAQAELDVPLDDDVE